MFKDKKRKTISPIGIVADCDSGDLSSDIASHHEDNITVKNVGKEYTPFRNDMDHYIQIFHTELQTFKSKILRTFEEDKNEEEKQRTSLLAEVMEVKKLVMDKDETIQELNITVDQLKK